MLSFSFVVSPTCSLRNQFTEVGIRITHKTCLTCMHANELCNVYTDAGPLSPLPGQVHCLVGPGTIWGTKVSLRLWHLCLYTNGWTATAVRTQIAGVEKQTRLASSTLGNANMWLGMWSDLFRRILPDNGVNSIHSIPELIPSFIARLLPCKHCQQIVLKLNYFGCRSRTCGYCYIPLYPQQVLSQ